MLNIQQYDFKQKAGKKAVNREVGLMIRMVSNLIGRSFDNSALTEKLQNITGTNTWLIAYIAEHSERGVPVFQRDIEEHFGITRSTVSKVVKLMEKKGLVERHSVAHDARLKRLVLTPEAAALATEMKEDAMRLEARLTAGFSEPEREQLLDYLQRLQKNME